MLSTYYDYVYYRRLKRRHFEWIFSNKKISVANPIPMPRMRKALIKSVNWMGTGRETRRLFSAKHWSALGTVGRLFTTKRRMPVSDISKILQLCWRLRVIA